MFSLIQANRYLIAQMVQREVQQRYRGSVLGFVWSFLYPILMLLVYMFVFGVVMRMKWGIDTANEGGEVAFGVIMFAGLLLHGFLADVLVRSCSLIITNPQYVKKVVFPLPILPVVTLGSACFHLLIGLFILVVFALITGASLSAYALLTPLVLLPFVLFVLGLSWLLAALCVYLRDIAQIITVVVTLLLFLAPILYPLSLVPVQYQSLMLWLNPLTVIVEQLRAVLLFANAPNWVHLGVYFAIALMTAVIGYQFFKRTEKGFADVL